MSKFPNKKIILLPLLSVILLAMFFGVAFAQTTPSRQIDVSAYVLGKDDLELQNGQYQVRFAIYSRDRETADPYPSVSDSRIWEETQEVEINNGILNAYLGAKTPLPESLDFSSNSYYLGIRIGTDSEMTPRKKIAAIPLAINALTANSLRGAVPGKGAGNILVLGKGGTIEESMLPEITTLGTVDSGTWEADPIANEFIEDALSGKTYNDLTLTSNADGFSIEGGTTSRELTLTGGDVILNAPGTVGSIAYSNGTGYAFSASGTAGQVLLSGGSGAPTWGSASGLSQWINDAGGIHYSAGNVGIGTDADASYVLKTGGGNLYFQTAGTNYGRFWLANPNSFQIDLNDSGGSDMADLILGGIGFTSYFEASAGDGGWSGFTTGGSGTSRLGMYVDSPADGSGGTIGLNYTANFSNLNTVGDGYTALKLNVTDAQAGADGNRYLMDLQVDSASKFVIDSAGNVGIGEVNPLAYLQIKAGTASANTAPLKFTSGTNLTIAETGAFEYDGSELYFTPSGTTRETVAYLSDITAGHNAVTINATANGLSVDGNQVLTLGLASTSTIGALSDTDWDAFNNKVSSQWTTAGADIYYNAGSVGIGTLTPGSTLDVAGIIRATSGANYLEMYHDGTDAILSTSSGEIMIGAGGDFILDAGVNFGVGTASPTSIVDIEQQGTAKVNTDLLEITNSGNAADMDATLSSILFNQWYYDASTPAVADAGRISFGTETDWTSTVSTQDSHLSFSTALDGTVAERMRITSAGDILLNTQLKIMENTDAAYYGIFDVDNITVSDKTYTFPDANGTVALTDSALTGTFDGINLATGTQGGVPYFSSTTQLTTSAAGTTGQALISGGTGAPTWFAPTAGSILFAGTSGILEQDNANFFWENTSNYLQLGNGTANKFSFGLDSGDSDKFKIYSGSGIAGTSEFTIDTNGLTSIANLEMGAMNFADDAGAVSWIDMGVVSATDNTVESYTAQLDGNDVLTIYGLATGSGGVDNIGVGIGTITPSNLLDIEKAGTAKANTDLLEITNSGNAADMDATLSSILFNQWYYDASAPAVADSGRITFGTETDWTSTASTQDSYLSFQTALDGTIAEKMRITSGGNVGIGMTPTARLHLAGVAGIVSFEVNSNETTAGNNVLALRSDVAGADDLIFRVQADGAVFADGAYTGTGADYAEYFETSDMDLESGEAVCLDPEKENAVKRCVRTGDNNLMGVVSSNPSIVGNSADGRDKDSRYKIVAMLGQIQGRISSENGIVQIGDSLTSAIIPGYLRKADPGESTVGVALQNFSGEQGSIQILISRKNKSLTVEKVEEAVSLRIAEMDVQDQVDSLIAEARTGLDEAMLALSSGIDARILNLTAIIEAQMDEIRADNRANLNAILQNSTDINILTAQVASILGPDPTSISSRLESLEILSRLSSRNLENGGIEITIIDPAAPTIGESAIPAGESLIMVNTKAVTADSKIYITPIGSTDNQVIYVGAVEEATGFEVKVDRITEVVSLVEVDGVDTPVSTPVAAKEIKFDWWIVESK